VGGDPRGQLLTGARFGVHIAAGPEHTNEQLHGHQLARPRIDDDRPLAGEVDEGLLAGAVNLAHGRFQGAYPALVVSAELAIPVAGGVLGEVFQVEPLQGHPGSLELLVELGHGGQRSGDPHHVANPAEQTGLELGVIPLGRQRPRHAGLLSPVAVRPHRADADPAGPGNGPVGQVLLVFQPKDFTDLSHQ
jgi:hypothetical protein